MLYFAYGANLNLRGMKRRCPRAVAAGAAKLDGYRLEFRTHATIVPDPNAEVPGVLYRLTPGCWRALENYEGPEYTRIAVTVETSEGRHEATAYVLKAGERAAPSLTYFTEIARGYVDWKFDPAPLRRARLATLHALKSEKSPRRGGGAAPR